MQQSLIFRLAFLSICVIFFAPNVFELFNRSRTNDSDRSKLQPITSEIAVIAHRGASEYGPENSLAAYNQAIKMGANYIELDVQMTKDGHLIVMHDQSLKRTTNAKKMYPNRSPWLVRDFNLEEIRKLDAGSWFNRKYQRMARKEFKKQRVPTFEEVIQFVEKKGKRKVGLFIELKEPSLYPGVEEKVVTIMKNHGVSNDPSFIFLSKDESSLRKLKELDPSAKIIQLYPRSMFKGLNVNREFKRIKEYAAGIGPSIDIVTPNLIKKAHLNGLFVDPWTINKLDDMAKLLSIGVDGEITNNPKKFTDLLGIHKCASDPKCI